MDIQSTKLEGVKVVVPKVFRDTRGYFFESHQAKRYPDMGITCNFVQDNVSYSTANTLRGLHYQYPDAQAKLVSVLKGQVFDVAVDIRKGSPTFGQWESVLLSADNHLQLFIPEGFAHGFCVLSADAVFSYKCSEYYTPASEHGIVWNDPDIGIDWPVAQPLLSDKDAAYPLLRDVSDEHLPIYR